MTRGHYTFRALLSVEADSEDEARREIQRRLARLHEAEYVTGFGVEHLAHDLTYSPDGGLRVPS